MSYKLLIIEDEDIIRKGLVCSYNWMSMGCDPVLEAGDGLEAVEQIKTFRPDIVIMDLNIPLLGGLEVLENTCGLYGYGAIVLTGYPEFEYAQRAVNSGAVSFLLKPVEPDELSKAVERAKLRRQGQIAYEAYQEQNRNAQDFDILSNLDRGSVKSDLVHRMLAFVDEHYQEKITMRELATAFHYSETFLIRKFKEETGLGFSEYLTRFRIQQSITLLRKTSLSTESIAESCGFLNAKYFNAVFKKHVGFAPRTFAARLAR